MIKKTPEQLKQERLRQIRIQQVRQRQLLQRQKLRKQEAAKVAPPVRPKPKPPHPLVRGADNLGWKPDEGTLENFNNTVYIIGGGPSLQHFNWKLLNASKFIVGINNAYQVCPNMQVNYFTDDDWYKLHQKGLIAHDCIKIKGSLNPGTLGRDTNIKQMHLTGEKGIEMNPNRLKHGRNSPYAAINMVIQWGFKKIYMLGMDMQYGEPDAKSRAKKKTHWHEGHRRLDGEASYAAFMRNYQELPKLIEPLKVSIINVNDNTKLTAFPIETYEQHFGTNWSTE